MTKLKKMFELPVELYHNRQLIFSLAKNDFKTKYAGSYLGIVWAFVQAYRDDPGLLVCIHHRSESGKCR